MRTDDRPDGRLVRQQLGHVYWVGGGSGGAKSTVAAGLAELYGLRLYDTDEVMAEHATRLTPEQAPLLHAFASMDMDERWVNRSAQQMLETFHWYHGEGFNLIIDDLLRLPRQPVIVEGFRLLPHLVKPLLATPSRAVWLLPSPAFRRAVFHARGPQWGFLAKTSDPGQALENVLARDSMFTGQLRTDLDRLRLHHVRVDGTLPELDLVAHVAGLFGL